MDRPQPPPVVAVCGAMGAAEVAAVCDRVRAELEAAAGRRVVYVLAETVDLGLVDLLARLTLTARRLGATVRVVSPGDDLAAVLRLTGLERDLGVERAPGDERELGD